LSEVAERVLELVGEVAGGGAEADVRVSTGTAGLTRFAASFIHQNVAEGYAHVQVRVALDGRWATASTNRTEAEALRRLVESATAAARLRPVDPDYPGLAPPAPTVTTGNWDEATATARPEDRAAVVREFVAAAGDLPAAGYVETLSEQADYRNSAGQQAGGSRTAATVDGIARTATSDGVGRRASVRLGDLSGAEIGSVAAAKARAAAEPTDLPPGDYEVVLEPSCVANLLAFLALHGFNGRAVLEGRSFVELGVQQFDRSIRLTDDPTDELSSALPYDAEGTPHRRLDLVVAGVTSAVTHDRRTAAQSVAAQSVAAQSVAAQSVAAQSVAARSAAAQSTGHAVPGGERLGAVAADLRLAAGAGGTSADLAGGMRRGLLISDFWYTRILDPRTTVVTGLTRNGVWLVEDGAVVRPVHNLRFTQSYVEALGPGAVLGVGSDADAVGDRWSDGLTVAPSLRLARWRFTGGAAG
jgi:predicted Zn-dependent protease